MKKKIISVFSIILSVLFMTLIGCDCNGKKNAVSINYYSDASMVLKSVVTGVEHVGLLPEPACTNAINLAKKDGKTLYKLSLQDMYDNELKSYPQAVMLIKESVVSTDLVNALMTAINDSVNNITQEKIVNIVTAIKAIYENTTLSTTMSVDAFNGSNIKFITAKNSKDSVNALIKEMQQINSESANTVDDVFFYDDTIQNEGTSYSIVAPDGAPALAIGEMIKEKAKLLDKDVTYNVVKADQIKGYVGNTDIVILPLNLATKVYKESAYTMVGTVTNGNFYLVSDFEMTLSDVKEKLNGKQIASFNQNLVPDWMLKITLKRNNIEYTEV